MGSASAGRAPRRRASAGVATLRDIAAAAGVSAQTVSCVVNNNGSVSQEVRERVRQIADQMGYIANKSAKAMRTGRSQVIAFAVSDMSNPFFPELAQAVERAAAAAGYAVLLVDAMGSLASDKVEALKGHPVDGVIVTEYSTALDRLDLPIVTFSGSVRSRDTVSSNDVQGGSLLAEYLLDKGHRNFGLITSQLGGCVPVRRDAFAAYLHSREMIRWERFTTRDEMIPEAVTIELKRLDVTALVCSHDVIAIRTLRALRDLGISAPEQLSVVGFDDIRLAGFATPSLTTVRQPFEAMGSEAVRLLLERIANPHRRMRHIMLDVTLVERESVAPARRLTRSRPSRERVRVGD